MANHQGHIWRDIICEAPGCGVVEEYGLAVPREGAVSPLPIEECPACGAPPAQRRTLLPTSFGIVGDGPKCFKPVDMGALGTAHTRGEYKRICATIEDRFPGQRVEPDTTTRRQRNAEVDDIRHRSWATKKALGTNAKEIAEKNADARASAPKKAPAPKAEAA